MRRSTNSWLSKTTTFILRTRWTSLLIILTIVCGMLPSISSLPSGSLAQAASGTPTTVLVRDRFREWTIGGGFFYWSSHCYGFVSDNRPYYLRRAPVYGGPWQELATATIDTCSTFALMAADDSGVYYYNAVGKQIERRSPSSPRGPATPVVSETPDTQLQLDGSYVYWGRYGSQIRRVNRDGSGLVTFADNPNTGSIYDLLIDQEDIYWIGDAGLWKAPKNCAPLPCANKQQLAPGSGDNLFRHGDNLYWVDFNSPAQQRIVRVPRTDGLPLGIYTAPSDDAWVIGELGSDGQSLFFKEAVAFEGPGYGRLRRVPLDGGVPETLVDDITSSDVTLFTDPRGVYFAGGDGIYLIPFNAQALKRDFAATAMEVTQGIQSTANDVPLVAAKSTYVRFYARQDSGPPANAVGALLYGTRDGQNLPGSPLRSVSGTQQLWVGKLMDRGRPGDGWLFQLPESWIAAGTIQVRAVVDPQQSYSDSERSNNVRDGTFTFTSKAPICVEFIPVRTHAPRPSSRDPNVSYMLDLFKRLWPVSDVWTYEQAADIAALRIGWTGPFNLIPYPYVGPFDFGDQTEVDGAIVLASILERDLFTDEPDECNAAGARSVYVGIVHPDTDTNPLAGQGVPSSLLSAAWFKLPSHSDTRPGTNGWQWPFEGRVMAHELGHVYGRYHVDCGDPEGVDENYPYPPCQLDNPGPDSHYGFDVNSYSPIAPETTADYMSYSHTLSPQIPQWSSDYTWKAMFNNINAAPSSLATSGIADGASNPTNLSSDAASNLATAGSVVAVTGVITPSLSRGTLNYAWEVPGSMLGASVLKKWQSLAAPQATSVAGGAPASSAATGYHLRLLAADGSVLDDRTVSFAANAETPDGPQAFALTFPAPAAPVARLDLMVDTTIMATLRPGSQAPTVSITQPTQGEIVQDQVTVAWSASDPDSADNLLYTLQYSPDGGNSWQALATNVAGLPGTTSLTLTLSNLEGIPGSDRALVRVVASDGYHTALAISQPFAVTNRRPHPMIAAPTDGQSTPAGQPVTLRGFASDAETGGIKGNGLQWVLDGRAVGSGEDLLVAGLAPGDYDVSLTARDPAGQEQTTHTTMSIAPLSISVGAVPTLDGSCDEEPYASAAQIQLAPYPDGAQATVSLIRTDTDLWACFSGMSRASSEAGSFAGVRVDVNNSRDNLAQPTDYGFFVGVDGTPQFKSGDGQVALRTLGQRAC